MRRPTPSRCTRRPATASTARPSSRRGSNTWRWRSALPELRIDPLTGLRVIVAGERGSRPGAFLDIAPRPPIAPASDPFAAGHEDRTPPEVYALRDNGSWRVRVVPNLYPALSEDGAGDAGSPPLAGGRGAPDLFAGTPARGAHEVVINAPDPVSPRAERPPLYVETALFV